MILMLARHKVQDSDVFIKGYTSESITSIREQFGVKEDSTWATVQDNNDVLVIHYFDDEASANAFLASKDLQEAMQSLGVNEPPKIQLFKQL